MTVRCHFPHRQGREGTRAVPHVASLGPGAGPSRGRDERAGETAPGETGDGLNVVDVLDRSEPIEIFILFFRPTERRDPAREAVDDSFIPVDHS